MLVHCAAGVSRSATVPAPAELPSCHAATFEGCMRLWPSARPVHTGVGVTGCRTAKVHDRPAALCSAAEPAVLWVLFCFGHHECERL